MIKAGKALAIVGLTCAILCFFFILDPFARTSDLLDAAFSAPPRWTQVEVLYKDERTQEVSRGESPVHSFELLADYWRSFPEKKRIAFVGNSQMQSVSLARGEDPPRGPEKTYVDLVADQLSGNGNGYLVYRLSAGGMSYAEALWYSLYLENKPDIRPSTLVLQVNYQSFWNGGIRDGMLEMLQDSVFRNEVEKVAASRQPIAEVFQESLRTYSQQVAAKGIVNSNVQPSNQLTRAYGYEIESKFRSALERIPGFEKRSLIKGSFLQMLYRERLYLLHLRPSTARSITGARLLSSQSAIEEIAQNCRKHRIQLILFNAPVNPDVSLYRTAGDRDTYHQFLLDIARRNSVLLYDFEEAIPGDQWGRVLNGPDPQHLGRKAHHELASRLAATLSKETVSN